MAGTWALATFAFTLLNLDATSMIAAWWVFPVQAAIALAVPVAAVAIPSYASAASRQRRPERRCRRAARAFRARASRRAEGGPPSSACATRRASAPPRAHDPFARRRRRGRDDVAQHGRRVGQDRRRRVRRAELRRTVPARVALPFGSLDAAVRPGGLTRIEYWNIAKATIAGPDGTPGDVATVFSAPSDTTSADFPLVAGRLLSPGDDHAVVVTQTSQTRASAWATRSPSRGPVTWTVVGVVAS